MQKRQFDKIQHSFMPKTFSGRVPDEDALTLVKLRMLQLAKGFVAGSGCGPRDQGCGGGARVHAGVPGSTRGCPRRAVSATLGVSARAVRQGSEVKGRPRAGGKKLS